VAREVVAQFGGQHAVQFNRYQPAGPLGKNFRERAFARPDFHYQPVRDVAQRIYYFGGSVPVSKEVLSQPRFFSFGQV